jgi:hypothetical protein
MAVPHILTGPWSPFKFMPEIFALTAAIFEAMIGPQRSFFGGEPVEKWIPLTLRGREVSLHS